MRNEEKLYLAIGEIDERLIEEAGSAYKKPLPIKKMVAAAACVVLVTVAAIGMSDMFLLMGNNGNSGGDMAPGMNGGSAESEIPENGVLVSDIGKLTLLETSDMSFTFRLEVYLPTALPIDIYLYSKDGSTVYTTAENVSTSSVYRPTILIDGEAAERLPGEIGRYEVTISFEGIEELDLQWQRYFTIDNFGPFEHGLELD
nr:hypothetical protein [Oscillospiraceae bacterium]